MNQRETQDQPRRLEAWGWGTLTIILLARIVTMAGPDVYQAAVSRPWMFLATGLGMFLAMVPYLYTGRLDALLQGDLLPSCGAGSFGSAPTVRARCRVGLDRVREGVFSSQAKTHMRSISAVVGISLLLLSAARAQEHAGFTHCRSITANDERLNCYDRLSGLAQQTGPKLPDQGYQAISLTDVKLDQDALRGRRVEVSGNLVVGSDVAFLLSGNADTSPLVVDFKAISREQRRTMLERCGASGCPVTIRGRVDRVMAQPGIVADNLEVH